MKAPKDQHFLNDTRAVERIADAVPVAGRVVLEIGPGGGILTEALLRRDAVVHAVELDTGLLPNLERRFADELADERLTITQGDASRSRFPRLNWLLQICRIPSPRRLPSVFWKPDLKKRFSCTSSSLPNVLRQSREPATTDALL